jgi:hypothetical protein
MDSVAVTSNLTMLRVALDVDTACFGHGEPIASDAGARIREMAGRL